MTSTGAPVLVSDAETRTALAVTRALGRRGIPVIVLAHGPGALAAASRFAAGEVRVPDAARDPEGWAEAVRGEWRKDPAALLLPVTDLAVGTALQFGLDREGPVAAPSCEAFQDASDKYALLAFAKAAGLDSPQTELVENVSALTELPPGFAYPVVLKSRRSRWLEAGAWREGGVCLVANAAALDAARADPRWSGGALLQEHLPGHGRGLFFLVDRGHTVACFAHRRVREKPPSGGVSVVSESEIPDPGLREAGERLLRALEWHGVAMLELRSAPDGRHWVMEVNPRLWGSLQLAVDAGVDFPSLLVALHRDQPLPETRLRAGARLRWLLGDIDHLGIALRRPAMRRAIGRSPLGVIGQFLKSFFDGTRLEVLRWDDPRPFLAELRGRMR